MRETEGVPDWGGFRGCAGGAEDDGKSAGSGLVRAGIGRAEDDMAGATDGVRVRRSALFGATAR